MSKMLFINLPVRDLAASTRFYEALGASLNPQFSDEGAANMMFTGSFGVMLLTYKSYSQFTQRPIGDARKESQALLAITTDSRDAVTATIEAGIKAGGKPDPNPAQDHGFMVNRTIEDPDGYVWEIVWMDMVGFAEAQKQG